MHCDSLREAVWALLLPSIEPLRVEAGPPTEEGAYDQRRRRGCGTSAKPEHAGRKVTKPVEHDPQPPMFKTDLNRTTTTYSPVSSQSMDAEAPSGSKKSSLATISTIMPSAKNRPPLANMSACQCVALNSAQTADETMPTSDSRTDRLNHNGYRRPCPSTRFLVSPPTR